MSENTEPLIEVTIVVPGASVMSELIHNSTFSATVDGEPANVSIVLKAQGFEVSE